MPLKLARFVTGPIDTNTYVLTNEQNQCLLFDPSSGCTKVIQYCENEQVIPEAILLTHAHFDHIIGLPEILSAFPKLPTEPYLFPSLRENFLYHRETQRTT